MFLRSGAKEFQSKGAEWLKPLSEAEGEGGWREIRVGFGGEVN